MENNAGAGTRRPQGHGDLAPRMETDAGYLDGILKGVLVDHDKRKSSLKNRSVFAWY
jgi:hypothetical protein